MNITLIGMPGCGKSTVGRELAQRLSMRFVDVDDVIMERTGLSLRQIIEEQGDEGFRRIEDEANASLVLQGSVIAPGGSVVYGSRAMEHLKQISTVVYLDTSLEDLRRRLRDLHARGVTFKPGQTLEDLYNERTPLYKKYARVTVNTDGKNVHQLVREIREALKQVP